MKKLLVAMSAFFITTASWAAYIDGNQLKRWCDIDVGASDGACFGYVLGVADMLNHPLDSNMAKRFVCLPNNASAGQIQAVTKKFLLANPEILHWPAHALVNNALIDAFPCKR